jgi:hypothetical protein
MTSLPQPRLREPAKLNLDVHQKQKQTQVCATLKEWGQVIPIFAIPIFAIRLKVDTVGIIR